MEKFSVIILISYYLFVKINEININKKYKFFILKKNKINWMFENESKNIIIFYIFNWYNK